MPDVLCDRNGRLPKRHGVATRERLLDTLFGLMGRVGWRRLTPIEVAREAGVSAATFYVYFPELEDAMIALAVHLDEAGGKFPDHLRMILGVLEFEGWTLLEFSNNTTIEEW